LPRQAIDPSLDRVDIYYDFIKTYQADFMNYKPTSPYLGLNGGIIDNWNFEPDPRLPGAEGRLGTSLPDMAFALTLNPNLKVLIQHGYYDLNTVFHQTELNITRAGLAAKVPVKTYEGGHGVLPGKTRSYEHVMQDLDAFYAQPQTNMIAALNAPFAERDGHE
jgi:carboxypeptidase C (cathepsin A)